MQEKPLKTPKLIKIVQLSAISKKTGSTTKKKRKSIWYSTKKILLKIYFFSL